MSQSYEVAAEPDPVTAIQAFATRQGLLRAWGEFQGARPLTVAPVSAGIPFGAGTDLVHGAVAETIHGMQMAIAVNAVGPPAVAVLAGPGDGPAAGGAGDRPALPRGHCALVR